MEATRSPISITAYALLSALGRGAEANRAAIRQAVSGLRPCDWDDVGLPIWIGRIDGLEQCRLRDDLGAFDCRNNRLAQLGLETDRFSERVAAAVGRYGSDRVGLVLGTSTSGIAEAESAYARRDPGSERLPSDFRYATTHNLASLSEFCRAYLGLNGPVMTISTACSSSAKAFAAGARYLQTRICDAVVVGGVDSLCLTTLYGFNSLELLSSGPCAPWDVERDGISIGEAAGFALLECGPGPLQLLGYGESVDAHHMSTPHPQGEGAVLAMQRALTRAGLRPEEIDYVNLHGTGTRLNDASEDQGMQRVFRRPVAASSTKGWTGHTLGAAGIVEAVLAMLAIEQHWIPPCRLRSVADPGLATRVVTENRAAPVRRAMSNAFGFGGSNCSLIFGAGR